MNWLTILAIIYLCFSSQPIKSEEVENFLQDLEEMDCNKIKAIYDGVNEDNPENTLRAAFMHYMGICVERDYDTAYVLFSRAANHGYLIAYEQIAKMLQLGIGTKRDLDESSKIFKWLIKEKESSSARHYLCITSKKFNAPKIKYYPDCGDTFKGTEVN
ncbi:sel1 repeat family protein [Simiduia agarivorans]|uniref:Sel1 repeat family protein n=1 Tax=Simiduia agarivorans (strain DSM 21679 / JCM 13881 / BCRC 17597 / SA1) TaxID=1117647 RepID=K4L3Y4_SIMAS|nr:sel1 repeat family protein [Simiduia agarivorans]AFV00923.1 hypothetical protein M5M_18970 [Simiduia agarivorans SA1 = DSM 21679]